MTLAMYGSAFGVATPSPADVLPIPAIRTARNGAPPIGHLL
jgi:hypothetical protein